MTQFHGILLNPRDLFKRRPTQPALLDTASNSEDLTHDDGSEEQSTRRNSETSFGDLIRLMDE